MMEVAFCQETGMESATDDRWSGPPSAPYHPRFVSAGLRGLCVKSVTIPLTVPPPIKPMRHFLIAVFVLAACSIGPIPAPRMPFMVVKPSDTNALPEPDDPALQQGLEVDSVTIADPVRSSVPIEPDTLREALINSLASHGLLAASRPAYRLQMSVASVTLPADPMEFWIGIQIDYRLMSTADASIPWTESIATTGQATGNAVPADFANYAVNIREAMELAVQDNIRQMLDRLYQKTPEASVKPLDPILWPALYIRKRKCR
jgi:hypothetical protein